MFLPPCFYAHFLSIASEKGDGKAKKQRRKKYLSDLQKKFSHMLEVFFFANKQTNWEMEKKLLNKLRHSEHSAHSTAVCTDGFFPISGIEQ